MADIAVVRFVTGELGQTPRLPKLTTAPVDAIHRASRVGGGAMSDPYETPALRLSEIPRPGPGLAWARSGSCRLSKGPHAHLSQRSVVGGVGRTGERQRGVRSQRRRMGGQRWR